MFLFPSIRIVCNPDVNLLISVPEFISVMVSGSQDPPFLKEIFTLILYIVFILDFIHNMYNIILSLSPGQILLELRRKIWLPQRMDGKTKVEQEVEGVHVGHGNNIG
jgi:hypothetical protein